MMLLMGALGSSLDEHVVGWAIAGEGQGRVDLHKHSNSYHYIKLVLGRLQPVLHQIFPFAKS